MKGLAWTGLVLAAFWLQASFFGALRPFDVVPNLLLVILLIAASICTASQLVTLSVVSGVLLDLASGADFGLRTAFYSLLAITLIMMRRSGADLEQWSMGVAALAGGTLLYNAAVIASLITGGVSVPLFAVAQRILLEFVVNLMIFVAIKWVLTQALVRITDPRGH